MITTVIDSGLTMTLSDELVGLLKQLNASGVCHPLTGQSAFLGSSVVFTFSKTGTLALSRAGTHVWPYADAPTDSFDSRGLHV